VISPKPLGNKPPQLGQDKGGGATLDSTLRTSDTVSLLFGVEHQLFWDKVPRDVKGQSKFVGETGDELLGADLITRAFEVEDDHLSPLFIDR
jgi:hypothetical protein